MPSEIVDQRRSSSLCLPQPAATSSFFFDELRLPAAERKLGFWKRESMPDHSGTEGMPLISGNRTVGSSMAAWSTGNENFGNKHDPCVQPASLIVERNKVGLNETRYENGLFSSSLSDIFDRKLRLSSNNVAIGQSVDTINSNFGEDEAFKSLEEIEAQTIGYLLPDDDDLLSGVIDDLDYSFRPNVCDDMNDDIFYTGGGLELEADDTFNGHNTSDFSGGLASNTQQGALVANEHPFGEHPSRTLFVRNINSNVEDAELKALFEQFGDIRTLYTTCKHRGFVMISYYDIRAARNAMRALQNRPLRRRKLDIHFSIPKDNPSDKDVNQGTLVVFNLDSSVSNDEIRQIFGIYGEIKEIRETPHKQHHKFIEFFDIRAAEAALRALNRSDIAGKKIKLEPSRPGGARRCIMQQLSPDLGQEESCEYRHESPPNNPPTGFCISSESILLGGAISNGLDNEVVQVPHSAIRAPVSPFMESAFNGIASSVTHNLSSPVRVASVGSHSNPSVHGEFNPLMGHMKFGLQRVPNFHPHSHPEYYDGVTHSIPYNLSTIAPMVINTRPADQIDARHIHKVGSSSFNKHSFELNDGAFRVPGNGSCPLHGHQYIWNNANAYHQQHPGLMIWSNPPSFVNNIPGHPPPQMHGLAGAPSQMMNAVLPLPLHHVGSSPTVNCSLWDTRAFPGDVTNPPFLPSSLGTMGISGNSPMDPLEFASHNIFPHDGGNCMDHANVGFSSPQQRCHMFHRRNAVAPGSFDATSDRIRSRRSDVSAIQADSKRQYELDIERIVLGDDSRTTLMIKNIPNKYTSKMLLAAIDENNRGTYDFIYLPIDFKNKCNVGYAFINMIDPQQIIPFYKAFNGKKWEKFNSEKVASLAYARIQGKAALIAHFQNSSLMNEDKRCRPILFHSDGPNAGDQEPFPMGVNVRSRPGRSRTSGNEENHHASPASSPNREEMFNVAGSSFGSTKESA